MHSSSVGRSVGSPFRILDSIKGRADELLAGEAAVPSEALRSLLAEAGERLRGWQIADEPRVAAFIDRLAGKIDVHGIVAEQLGRYTAGQLRQMILGLTRQHLSWLEVYGGVFGAVGGVVIRKGEVPTRNPGGVPLHSRSRPPPAIVHRHAARGSHGMRRRRGRAKYRNSGLVLGVVGILLLTGTVLHAATVTIIPWTTWPEPLPVLDGADIMQPDGDGDSRVSTNIVQSFTTATDAPGYLLDKVTIRTPATFNTRGNRSGNISIGSTSGGVFTTISSEPFASGGETGGYVEFALDQAAELRALRGAALRLRAAQRPRQVTQPLLRLR